MIVLPKFGKVTMEEANLIFDNTNLKGGFFKSTMSNDNEFIKENLGKFGFDCESTKNQSVTMGLKSKKELPFTTHSEISVPDGVSRESVFKACVDFIELFMSDKHQNVEWEKGENLNFTLTHQPFFFQPDVPKNLKVKGSVVNIQSNHHLLVQEKYENEKFSKQDHCSLYRIMEKNGKLVATVNNFIPGIKASPMKGLALKGAYVYDYFTREKNQLQSWMDRAQEIEKNKKQKLVEREKGVKITKNSSIISNPANNAKRSSFINVRNEELKIKQSPKLKTPSRKVCKF